MITAEAILKRVKSLPALSQSVGALAAVLRNERSSASDIEKVIKPDPSMTTNLLKIANSAYFGCPCEVTSIRQAITILGHKNLFDLVTSAAFSKVIPHRLPGYEVEAQAFWIHCAAVAILAEHLAKELGFAPPDLTFTAGLLHDVGKLAIGTFLSQESTEVNERLHNSSAPFVTIEKQVLGTDHAELGAALANQWGLPQEIANVAKYHHNPNEAPSDLQKLIDLVHVADCLAHSLGYGADIGELSRKMDQQAADRLLVKIKRLELVISETQEQIRTMGAVFTETAGEKQ
jgi:putative nucleotidyltransferase with HDIG domain